MTENKQVRSRDGVLSEWDGAAWQGISVHARPQDWATFIALVNAQAALGRAVQMGPGTWTCDAAAALVSNAHIIGGSNVVVNSTLAPSGGQSESVFYAVPTTPVGAVDTTTVGAIAVGATSFVVTSMAIGAAGGNVAVGDTVVVGETNRFFYYLVRGIDLGTKTITVDRPIVSAFASGVACGVRVVPTNIRIEGANMRIRGTGDRAIGISGAYRCVVSDVIVEPNDAGSFFSDTPVSYDIGGRFSRFQGLWIDNGNAGLSCLSLESSESVSVTDCELRRGATNHAGLLLGVAYFCKIARVRAVKCHYGVWLNSGGGADIYACRNNTITDCEFRENAAAGVYILNGSSFNSFIGCSSTRNGTFGVYVAAGTDDTEPTRENSFVNCITDGNTSGGFQTLTGTGTKASKDTLVTNLQCVGGGGFALDCGGSVTINGLIARSNPSGGIQVTGAASLIAKNVTLQKTTAVFWAGVIMNTTGSISIAGLRVDGIAGAGTSVVYSHTAGYLVDEDVRILSGTPTIGYSSAASANAKYRRGSHSDLSQATTPYSFGAGSLQNWGTLVLNGATPVVVNAVCTAQDVPLATLKTVGGAQGVPPSFVCGAGTITGTGIAADTSTWQYWIP